MSSEQRLEECEGLNYANIWGKNLPGKGNDKSQCLVAGCNKEANRNHRDIDENKIREKTEDILKQK